MGSVMEGRQELTNMTSDRYRLVFLPLPHITGVNPLSAPEVKQDLDRVLATLPVHDNEAESSDDSPLSEDILPSSYPVKPRKYNPRWARRVSEISKSELSQAEMVAALSPAQQESLIFQTMEFFRAAESTRTDIYIAEREREVLELQYQSVRDAFIARAKDFSLTRQGSETYLRAMQGLATRSMQQYVMNSRRIAMLAQMHESLRRSRERISELGKQNITKSVEADSVDILHIKLLPGAQEALLFVGQHLRTPYGEGVLRKISPKTGHLTVQLSFGTMFTTISTLLSDASCRRFALSDHLSSSVQLLEDWDAISTQRCLGLSNESQRIVNRLLSAPHSSGGQSAEAVVDADDEGDLSDVGTTSHGADMNESAGSVWNPEEFAALVLGPAPLLPLLATKHLRSRPHPLQRSIVSAPRKDDVEAAQRSRREISARVADAQRELREKMAKVLHHRTEISALCRDSARLRMDQQVRSKRKERPSRSSQSILFSSIAPPRSTSTPVPTVSANDGQGIASVSSTNKLQALAEASSSDDDAAENVDAKALPDQKKKKKRRRYF